MSRRTLSVVVAGFALVVAACAPSGSSSNPVSAVPPSGTLVAVVPSGSGSSAPSSAPSNGPSNAPSLARGTCAETRDAGKVAVSIKDFEFVPAAITARVGEVIAFSNNGFEPHNATLDAGGCATSTLQTGNKDGLRFRVTGTYPFHCTVHPQMHGTLTVTR